MEAIPIMIETPSYEEKVSKQLNIIIESDLKKKYSVEILAYTSYLEIKINLTDKNQNINYIGNFSLDIIKKISKYFLICESISDVAFSIEPNINRISLIEEKNQIKLIIPLNHPLCKEAIFIIPEKIKEYNSKELYYIISELRNNIQEQKNKINNQQDLINKQQNEIKELKDRIDKIEDKIKDKDIDIDKNESDLKYSNIIPNDYETEKQIKKWINPNKKIKLKLLFRMTRDGDKCSDFHKYCDNKGPTLTLVHTDKDYKFGGYTPFSWRSERGESPTTDKDTFLFSLNLMKKFCKIKEGSTVYFTSGYGPCFGNGGSDFYIKNNLHIGGSVKGNYLNNFELTNGEDGQFTVKELEIYKFILQ